MIIWLKNRSKIRYRTFQLRYAKVTVETCAYAGTGNVEQMQALLQICSAHIEDEKNAMHQAVAVIGLALVSFGEEIGSTMVLRSFDHIMQSRRAAGLRPSAAAS